MTAITKKGRVALLTAFALILAGSVVALPAADAAPPFEIEDFVARSLDAQGDDYAVAGGHPHDVDVSFSFPRDPGFGITSQKLVRSTFVDSPAGFVANPAVAGRCTMAQLKLLGGPPICPARSEVGTIAITVRGHNEFAALFNMVPEGGYPAQLGFRYDTSPILIYPRLRSRTGGYGITAASPGIPGIGITDLKVTLYGVPSQRPLFNGAPPVGGPPMPFLSNPGDCLVAEPQTTIFADT